MAYNLLGSHQHRVLEQKKEHIKPYFVVDGVMINHNKGSMTTFLYLCLKSIKVVKTLVPRAINLIHIKMFT